MKKKTTTKTELIEIRYSDLGLPRPGLYGSGIFHIHRVVTDIQPVESQHGQAESGVIRFGGKQVEVYRRCESGSGSWWSTNKADVLEPIRAVYSLVSDPTGSPWGLVQGRLVAALSESLC